LSRTAQFAVFITFAVAILAGLHTYLWFRLVRDTAIAAPWRTAATVAIVALAVSMPIAMGLYRFLPRGAGRLAGGLPFVWMGAMMLLVFWFFATDALRLASLAASKLAGWSFLAERRLLVARGVALAGGALVLILSALAVANAARPPVLKDIELRMSRLPRALDGFSLVQIGDLHVGGSLHGSTWVADVVARINALSPDLVAITGDLVDAAPSQILDDLAPLSELRARCGIYFVTGNHEFYTGLDEWLPVFRRLGLHVLRNERVAIGDGAASFDLVGVDDYDGRRVGPGRGADLEAAVAGRDPSRFAVLLSHQPKIAAEAAGRGIDLILSGHTHGGQIWPFSALVRLQQPYLRGLYDVGAGTRLYVSDGTGTWGPPMRLGTQSEIVRVVLRAR
jgi:uncharacterized protein